ncbi:PAS domain-containing protein [Azospirillum agricola]|uniref:PAS domain-containing protein n=1 Tax=Azospirillum agricola TaxID=1720247 RepID=UPI000A0F06C1|nr:PAS domain-containing protein [Azospirillum agricola]SMH61943.1 transcriptional regulator [Azospirillum lipoferum]
MDPQPRQPADSTLSADTLARLGDALLRSAADAIVYSGRDGRIAFWNEGAERLFGFSAAEALGQSLDLIIPERQRPRHWEGYDAVMATGESRYGKGDLLSVPALHKDGRRISVEFTIVPLHDGDGGMLGMAAVLRDVTARFEELKALRRQIAGR